MKAFPNKKLEREVGKQISNDRLLILETNLTLYQNNIKELYKIRYEAEVFIYGTDHYIEKFQKLHEKVEKAILRIM